jgi:hypothetical protein
MSAGGGAAGSRSAACTALARRAHAFWHRLPGRGCLELSEHDGSRFLASGTSGLVLRDETAVELGAPGKASLCLVMPIGSAAPWPESVEWLGADLGELAGRSVGVAIVVVAAPASFDAVPRLRRAVALSGRVPGLMTRPLAGKLWLRVSRELLSRGFGLADLAWAMRQACLSELGSGATVSCRIAVDPAPELVASLCALRAEMDILLGEHRKVSRGADGEYVCAELACEGCEERAVCDVIRMARPIRG